MEFEKLAMLNLDNVIAERKSILDKAVAFFIKQPEVLAVFLSGSIPAKTEDAYSDIDLRVVVQPRAFDEFLFQNKLEYPKNFGTLLFNEFSDATPQICVSHFAPFNKLDIVYYRPQDLKPSYYYQQPLEVFHDPKKLVKECIKASKNLPIEPSTNKISQTINKIYANAHEAYRRIKREEIVYAQALIMDINKLIIMLDDWLNERFSASNPFGKCERRIKPELFNFIQHSYSFNNPADLMQNLKAQSLIAQKIILNVNARFKLTSDHDGLAIIIDLCK